MTRQQISKYERGRDQIPASVLTKIAAALGCTTGMLIGEAPRPATHSLAEQLAAPGAREILSCYATLESARLRQIALSAAKAVAQQDRLEPESAAPDLERPALSA